MSKLPGKRRNLWPWLPLLGLVVVIIPNVVLLFITKRVHPTLVEEHPYVASQHIDAEKARRAAFVAAKFQLNITTRDALHLTCRLDMPTPAPAIRDARLHLYRPDDIASDRILPWADTSLPLTVDLPKVGTWRAHLTLVAGESAMESAVQPLDTSTLSASP